MRKLLAAAAAILAALTIPALARPVEMTPDIKKALELYIRAYDFDCPVAKAIYAKERTARGTIFKVYCGPADGTDNVFTFAYRATLVPSGDRMLVEEW
ncbi:hypothetical protein ACU8LZ_12635 [Rhizobium leguminosarum]